VVKNKQGFHFQITNFKPEEVYDDLIDYAKGYNIPLTKTKDYFREVEPRGCLCARNVREMVI
jgi:hypothetical protein